MLISVVIPTFHAAKWIKRSLDSCVAQDFKDLEVIVSDNFSDDGIEEIVGEYKDRLDVKFFKEKQDVPSCGAGFNNAVKHAQGEFFIILSADDELRPGALRRVSEELNRGVNWVYGPMLMVNDKTGEEVGTIGEPDVNFDKMLYKMSISISSSFFRRSLLDKYGFLDYKRYKAVDDYEFMLRLLFEGVRAIYVDQGLVLYHIHGDNYSFENVSMGHSENVEMKKDYREKKISRQKEGKTAIISFATGTEYWQFIRPLVESAKKHLKVKYDFFLFTDSPEDYGVKVFPLEQHSWPLPTLMRYHSILAYEEEFKDYDFIFLQDIDTLYVSDVRDIFSEDITATLRGMYDVRRGLFPPFDENRDSAAYIKKHLYYWGGFVGGTRERFFELCRELRRGIDHDLKLGYTAIWNEESHLNKYLDDHPPDRTLDVSYCYPPSMLEYYRAVWGRDFEPKIIECYKDWRFTEKEKKFNNKIMSDFVPALNKYYEE